MLPNDATLTVTVENDVMPPYQGGLVLLTIHGQCRRHITHEKQERPKLDGFKWFEHDIRSNPSPSRSCLPPCPRTLDARPAPDDLE